VKTAGEISVLEDFGLEYEIGQFVVKHLLICSTPEERMINLGDWEFFENTKVGKNTLKDSYNDSLSSFIQLPTALNEVQYCNQHLQVLYNQMKEDVVYYSTLVNQPMFDFIMIDHHRQELFLYQITSVGPLRHAFVVNIFAKIISNFALPADYKINIVVITSAHNPPNLQRGARFYKNNKKELLTEPDLMGKSYQLSVAQETALNNHIKILEEKLEVVIKNFNFSDSIENENEKIRLKAELKQYEERVHLAYVSKFQYKVIVGRAIFFRNAKVR
jgi:hypothetical protein